MLIQKQNENISVLFYFMTNNYKYIKIIPDSLESLKETLIEIAKNNPYGMICPVIITNKLTGDEIRRIGSCCHVKESGECNVDSWIKTIQNDIDIKYFFKKNLNVV